MELGRVGIWSGQLRRADPAAISEAAAELDELGFGAIWIPGGHGGDVFGDVARLLDATTRATVATGILNIWMHTPDEAATGHAALTGEHPGRFLLGLGVSHEPPVTNSGQVYERPLAKMRDYLDALDAADPPVPVGERMLAALGPRMLELARDRSAGAHPYLVTPDHTAAARVVLGDGPLLATEVMVVLDDDAERARAVARQHLSRYMVLPNYTNNFLRHGFDRGRPARRRQRPPRRRPDRVGRPRRHRRPHRRAPRRGRRPRVHPGPAGRRRRAPRDAWRRLADAVL